MTDDTLEIVCLPSFQYKLVQWKLKMIIQLSPVSPLCHILKPFQHKDQMRRKRLNLQRFFSPYFLVAFLTRVSIFIFKNQRLMMVF